MKKFLFVCDWCRKETITDNDHDYMILEVAKYRITSQVTRSQIDRREIQLCHSCGEEAYSQTKNKLLGSMVDRPGFETTGLSHPVGLLGERTSKSEILLDEGKTCPHDKTALKRKGRIKCLDCGEYLND